MSDKANPLDARVQAQAPSLWSEIGHLHDRAVEDKTAAERSKRPYSYYEKLGEEKAYKAVLALLAAGEQAAGQREEQLTGYALAGCADRAGVVLKIHDKVRGYTMPKPEDWNRFAEEVRALRGAGQPEESGK